jgi:hypothetical protein
MKNLAPLAVMLFLFPLQIGLGQQPQIQTFSQRVEGVITGQLQAAIVNTDGWRILDVVKGSAVAKAGNLPSFADAKPLDNHNIEVSYSFGGLKGYKYVGTVSVQAAVVPGH